MNLPGTDCSGFRERMGNNFGDLTSWIRPRGKRLPGLYNRLGASNDVPRQRPCFGATAGDFGATIGAADCGIVKAQLPGIGHEARFP